MRLTLQWQENQQTKTIVVDGSKTISIGRDPYQDVTLDNGAVSRQHAVLFVYERAFYLQNRSRSSLTSVNGQPLTVEESRMLRHGDQIQLGPIGLWVAAITITKEIGDPVLCPNPRCARVVDLRYGNCPHCGQNLAGAVTQEFG